MRFRDIHLFDEHVPSDYLTKRCTSSRCLFDTLPIVDGFRWSSKQTVAGLRLRDSDGKELHGGTPTVDDSQPGTLIVRWPVGLAKETKGEFVLTFTESSLTIAAAGDVAANWYLESSHDQQAKLPVRKIERNQLSCIHRGTNYSMTAPQGSFSETPNAGWRLTPHDQRIMLDLSKRGR